MGILKSKIRSWILPQLLLITELSLLFITVYYNYIVQLVEKSDKEDNLEVTEVATTFCSKRRL